VLTWISFWWRACKQHPRQLIAHGVAVENFVGG
jgi:hypothetical protein